MMVDYIERQVAIEAAKRAWAKGLEPTQHIEEIPAANVREDLQGEWERFDDIARYRCSVCKNISAKDVTGWHPFLSKFCPNCGARMEV